jgi:hypothetical protein
MTKRAVGSTHRSDDKRAVGTAKNPKKIASVKPITQHSSRVESFKKGAAGGGAGRPKKVG